MKHLLVLSLILLLFGACTRPEPAAPADKAALNSPPTVAVSILPQRYWLKKLLGESALVIVLVPPGSSPETYAPTPQQMSALAKASLYVCVGHLPLEMNWLGTLSSAYPAVRITDPSQGLDLLRGHIHHGEKHDPKHNESSHNEGIDPHIWLSPRLVRLYCQNLAPILKEQFPHLAQTIDDNLAHFCQEIDQLDGEVRQMLTPFKGKSFMVFHPAWSYFARDYGLVQLSVEEEGKSPTPKHMRDMTDQAKRFGISTLFVQSQFDKRSAQAVAEALSIPVTELDPLAGDWSQMIRDTASALAQAEKQP